MLFAQDIPQSATDVLMLPMIMLFFGVVTYGIGYFRGLQARTMPRFRFVGLGLLIVAAFLGFQEVWKIWNSDTGKLYRDSLVSRKLIYSHYVSFFLPLVLILAIVLMELLYRNKSRHWE